MPRGHAGPGRQTSPSTYHLGVLGVFLAQLVFSLLAAKVQPPFKHRAAAAHCAEWPSLVTAPQKLKLGCMLLTLWTQALL